MRTIRTLGLIAVAGALVAAVGCADLFGTRSNQLNSAALSAAFNTVPQGYGSLSSSYVGVAVQDAGPGSFWLGGGRDAMMANGSLMGGGLNANFDGSMGMGHGFGQEGPFGGRFGGDDDAPFCANGTFDAGTGRVTCPTLTLPNGLTVSTSVAYSDASGKAQQAFDTVTTNTVNVKTTVAGTITFKPDSDGDNHSGMMGGGMMGGGHMWGDGRGMGGLLLGDTAKIVSATTTVNSASDRTTAGLAKGSTQRTVNGKSGGTEQTTGTSSRGNFTASRVVGDTTTGLTIPVSTTGPTYPTAGTVIRAMAITLTYTGQTPVNASRREVVTYDGSTTAKVVITQNGTTKNCTKPLPRGPLTCT